MSFDSKTAIFIDCGWLLSKREWATREEEIHFSKLFCVGQRRWRRKEEIFGIWFFTWTCSHDFNDNKRKWRNGNAGRLTSLMRRWKSKEEEEKAKATVVESIEWNGASWVTSRKSSEERGAVELSTWRDDKHQRNLWGKLISERKQIPSSRARGEKNFFPACKSSKCRQNK